MDGIINIYKEKGYTSHDVVAKLRGILHQKKIGHTGTLDPDATGVLPVCLGKATKVCELLADQDKSYRAVCQLGIETDTQDLSGTILQEKEYTNITQEKLEECLSGFLGIQEQIPPMYSALKVNGKKLYELAREGKTIERKPRKIKIHALELVDMDLEHGCFTMDITCSKGTYIRTLCHDIGQRLGCLGAMKSLVRTRVAIFRVEDAVTLGQVQQMVQQNRWQCDGTTEGEDNTVTLEQMQNIPHQIDLQSDGTAGDEGKEPITEISRGKYFRTVDSLFPEYPRYQIKEKYAGKLANGNPLLPYFLKRYGNEMDRRSESRDAEQGIGIQPGDCLLVYDEKGQFKAIYRRKQKDLRVRKMF